MNSFITVLGLHQGFFPTLPSMLVIHGPAPLNKMDTEYTLASVADGVAHIDVQSEIDNITMNENSGVSAAGFMVTTDLKGKQSGTLKLDMASGIVESEVVNTTIKGSMQVAGNEVPLTIQMKKVVTTKKI